MRIHNLHPSVSKTFLTNGVSPPQKLYGRPIQDTLPAHQHSFAPEWQRSAQLTEQQAAKTLQQAKSYCNNNAHRLPDLQNGSIVARP